MLWRTSPAVTELEQLTLSWIVPAARLPGDVARPHRGLRVDLDAGRAVRGAHGAPRSPRRRRLRARALVHRPRLPHPRPRDPPRAGRRRLPHARRRARPERCLRRRRHRRHDLDDVGRPRARDRRRGRRVGRVAARRRCLQRLGARLPRAAHAGLRARRLGRRQPAQVAVHADRLLVPLHVAPGTTCARRSRSRPSTCAPPPRAS